jgi:rubredoxin
MAEKQRFQCNNCGHRFEVEVLSEDEKREAKRERRPVSTVACPECHRTDLRRGWT